jgi:hypothetical protein
MTHNLVWCYIEGIYRIKAQHELSMLQANTLGSGMIEVKGHEQIIDQMMIQAGFRKPVPVIKPEVDTSKPWTSGLMNF